VSTSALELLSTLEGQNISDFSDFSDFSEFRDFCDFRNFRNLPDRSDWRCYERDGDRSGLSIVGDDGLETIDGVRGVGDGPHAAVRVGHAVGARHHVSVPGLLAALGVSSGHIVDRVSEGILRAGQGEGDWVVGHHSLDGLDRNRVGGHGGEAMGGHVEGGQMTEGVSSYCRHNLAVEGVEAMERMDGMKGVGRDSRKMVEGGVNWVDGVESIGGVEGQGGDGREGPEGLERQERAVSENSASHEVSGGSQGGLGCQGKHHHGFEESHPGV